MPQIISLVNGVIYMPTIKKTEAGYFLGVDPVTVVEVGDTEQLAAAVAQALARPVPVVPTPPRDAIPQSSTVKLAKLRSWATFDRIKTCWIVSERRGPWQIALQRNKRDGKGRDKSSIVVFPDGTSLGEIGRGVCDIIQKKAREIGQL